MAEATKSARTRQRILDATAHVLSIKGYSGTRLTDIAGPEAERMDGGFERWVDGFLFSLSGPIYAGTNEIQRNVIAERVLGLPRT